MPPVTLAYKSLPSSASHHALLPVILIDDTLEARCRIVVKVLARRMPTLTAWLRWSPTSPLAAQLQVLGFLAGIAPLWELLCRRGCIQPHDTHDTHAYRLTMIGWYCAHTPAPPLSHNSDWLHAVLDYLNNKVAKIGTDFGSEMR